MTELFENKFRLLAKVSYFNYRLLPYPLSSLPNGKKKGYKDWKKTAERFDKHQQSKCHKPGLRYEVIVPQCQNALEMNDENEKKTQGIKSAYLPYHSRNFAHQGLAVQGDNDDENNFIQLLRLQSKTFPEFTDWLSKKTER